MADAIGGVGPVARQAGVELEQLNGMVASMVGATGLSGSEVGTAIKGIISRIYRIGSEGEMDAGKSEQVLNKIGVSVRNAEGNFRKFNDILTDLNVKWGTLTNVQKANIGQTIAGTYHYSKFTALMDNFTQAQEATAMALNSSGSAMKENEKYLDSIEGRLSLLTSAFENFYSEAISSDLIKELVSGLTVLVNSFLNLKNVILVAVTALAIFKGAWALDKIKLFYTAIGVASLNLKGFITSVRTATTAQQAFKVATSGVVKAFNSLKLAFKANPFGIIMTALTLVISAYQYFKSAQQKAREEFEKSTQVYKEQTDEIENLKKQYEANYELAKTDATAKQKLVDIEVQLRKALGDSVEGLDLQNKKLQENLDILEEAEATKRRAYLRLNEQRVRELRESVETRTTGQAALGETAYGTLQEATKQMFGGMSSFTGIANIGFTESTARARQELLEQLGIDVNDSLKEQLVSYERILDNQDEYLAKSRVNEDVISAIAKAWELTDAKVKEANESTSQYNNELRKELLSKEQVKNVQSALTKEQQKVLELAISTVALENESVDAREKFSKTVMDMAEVVKGSDTTFMNDIIEGLEGIEGVDLSKVKNSIYELREEITKVTNPLKDLTDIIMRSESEVGLLSTAYGEMRDNQELSLGTIDKLAKEYPELITQMEFEGDTVKINTDLIKNEFEARKESWLKQVDMQKEKITNQRNATLSAIGLNIEEIKSIEQLDQAYAILVENSKIRQQVYSNYSDLQAKVLGANVQGAISEQQGIDYLIENDPKFQSLKDFKTNVSGYGELMAANEASRKIVESITMEDYTGKGSSKKSKKDSYTPPDALELELDYLRKYKDALAEINSEIENNRARQTAATDDEERIRLQKEELRLLELRTKATNELGYQTKLQAAVVKKTLQERYKGLKFAEPKKAGDTGDIMYDSLTSEITRLTNYANSLTGEKQKDERSRAEKDLDKLKELSEEYIQLRGESTSIWADIIKSDQEELEKYVGMILKTSEDLLDELQANMDKLDFQIDTSTDVELIQSLKEEKVKLLTTALKDLIDEYENLNSVTDEAVRNSEAFQNGLAEITDKLRDLQVQLKEGASDELKSRIENVEKIQDIIENMIRKGVELRKEALDEELDTYTEHMDDIIEQKKREFEEIDYEKDLKKQLEERQKIQNQMNILSLDNSLESYEKRKKLQEEHDKITEKIEDGRIKRERKLEIQALEDSKDLMIKSVGDQKEELDKTYTDENIAAFAQEAIRYENLQALTSRFPELVDELGVDFSNFETTMASFETKFGDHIGEVVKSVEEELVPAIRQAVKDIGQLSELKSAFKSGSYITDAIMANPDLADYVAQEVAKEQVGVRQEEYMGLESKKAEGTFTEADKARQQTLTGQASVIRGEAGLQEGVDYAGYKSDIVASQVISDVAKEQDADRKKIADYQRAYANEAKFRDAGLGYDQSKLDYYSTEAQKIRDKWDWAWEDLTGSYAKGGINTKTGLAMLHGTPSKPEYILNSGQFDDFLNNIANNFRYAGMNSSVMSGNMNNNLTININGNADSGTVRQIQNAGTDILQQLRRQLNKNGTFNR